MKYQWKKITVFTVIMGILAFLILTSFLTQQVTDPTIADIGASYGFPLVFNGFSCTDSSLFTDSTCTRYTFNIFNFIVDILIVFVPIYLIAMLLYRKRESE